MILVLALLSATLVPSFLKARAEGQLRNCRSNLKNVATALELYAKDWQGNYPSRLPALTPNILKSIPTCPAANLDTYSTSYSSSFSAYTVYCRGDHHGKASLWPNFPQYTSAEGLLGEASRPGNGWLDQLLGLLQWILFIPAFAFFVNRVGTRPEPLPQARELEQRHPWLGWLGWLSWVVLCLGCTGLTGIYCAQSWSRGWSALMALTAGGMVAEWTVRTGWRFWGKLSPAEREPADSTSAGPNPEIGASLRTRLVLTGNQRLLSRLLKLGLPLLVLALLTLGLPNPLLGLAVGALLSFPLYLWGKSWASELFERELELVPGSGVLLEHSRRMGRPMVRQLGTLAQVENLSDDGFCLGGRSLLVSDRDFLEALA